MTVMLPPTGALGGEKNPNRRKAVISSALLLATDLLMQLPGKMINLESIV